MDVQLYVYDLTHGMARNLSRNFLGIQLDAVYHTSLVFGDVEYFFGQGIHTCRPGTTHHGQPIERISMGTTHLPMEVILDYLESLKEVYTAESYDLFAHNCNNFTNDFGMFLVGKAIPDHITNLPKQVLDTPFGQMLRPQIDASMRSVTQAPTPPSSAIRSTTINSVQSSYPGNNSVVADRTKSTYGKVVSVTTLDALEKHRDSASQTATTIFFTSSTCAPCRMAYPTFDALAELHPHALFLKVDINSAPDVASRYQIRATPTFMTFSKTSKLDDWQGADPSLLRSNVERLIQQTFPPHPHTLLRLPSLQYGSLKPLIYAKLPPLDKLMAKLGDVGSKHPELTALRTFIEKRGTNPQDAALPDLQLISKTMHSTLLALPVEARFAAVDLLRCAAVDPRVSGFLAEVGNSTISALVNQVIKLGETCPHNLRLVTIHLACNLFTSPLFVKELSRSGPTMELFVQLITSSLLDTSHPTTRISAASLAFNLAAPNYRIRREEGREAIPESLQVELAASLLETLASEVDQDATRAMLLAFGYLLYCTPQGGELLDLCKALDAQATMLVMGKKNHETLAKEVASLL